MVRLLVPVVALVVLGGGAHAGAQAPLAQTPPAVEAPQPASPGVRLGPRSRDLLGGVFTFEPMAPQTDSGVQPLLVRPRGQVRGPHAAAIAPRRACGMPLFTADPNADAKMVHRADPRVTDIMPRIHPTVCGPHDR